MPDIFVSPSRWDAFNIALVEAIGLSVPAITTTTINLANDLKIAGACLLSPAEASSLAVLLERLANDKVLQKRLSLTGSSWIKDNCGFIPVGQQLLKLYADVLAESRRTTEDHFRNRT